MTANEKAILGDQRQPALRRTAQWPVFSAIRRPPWALHACFAASSSAAVSHCQALSPSSRQRQPSMSDRCSAVRSGLKGWTRC